MVEHAWIFVLLLFSGIGLGVLRYRKTKSPKNTHSNKQNRGQLS